MSADAGQAERREIFAEVQELVDATGKLLSQLHARVAAGHVPQASEIDALFRQAHTLKGIYGLLGATVRLPLAHAIEDVLDGVRMGQRALDVSVTDALLVCVEALGDDARVQGGSTSELEDQAPGLLARLAGPAGLDRSPQAGQVPSGPARAEPVVAPTALGVGEAPGTAVPVELAGMLTAYEAHRFAEAGRRGLPVAVVAVDLPLSRCEAALAAVQARLAEVGEVLTLLPSSSPQAAPNGEPSLRFALYVATDALPGRLGDLLAQVVGPEGAVLPPTVAVAPSAARVAPAGLAEAPQVAALATAPEQATPGALPPAEAMTAPAAAPVAAPVPATTDAPLTYTVRVDIRRLDRLMHWVNELSLTQLALADLATSLRRDHALVGPAVDLQREGFSLGRRVTELQAGLMALRMVPLAQLFERLVRSGHQAAHELGKEVRFVVRGEHTEVDKFVAEKLVDPLLHIVRNAVDHAVEFGAERRAAGKPVFATVQLTANTRGSQVVVRVADDGRGIDRAAVLRSALARGLIDEAQARAAKDVEVWRLLCAPGLSTRHQVGAYSGRGVGLDVAKTQLEGMGGSLDIDSVAGAGSSFALSAPLTLAIVPALVVAAGDEQLALPVTHVLETVALQPEDVLMAQGQTLLRVGEPVVPLVYLAAHLELLAAVKARARARYALVLGVGHDRVALAVDDLVSQQDIVIKSLGPRLNCARPFAGAAELSSKRMVLVLDGQALLHEVVAAAAAGGGP